MVAHGQPGLQGRSVAVAGRQPVPVWEGEALRGEAERESTEGHKLRKRKNREKTTETASFVPEYSEWERPPTERAVGSNRPDEKSAVFRWPAVMKEMAQSEVQTDIGGAD